MVPTASDPLISVSNVTDGDVLTYSLAILRGQTHSSDSAIHAATSANSPPVCFPAIRGHFTLVIELSPGANEVRLARSADAVHTSAATTLTLFLAPSSPTRPRVRLVYLLAEDSDGTFQTDVPTTGLDAGVARLRTAGLMVQAATAEMLHVAGLGRRTFALAPGVAVHRLRGLPFARAAALEDGALWAAVCAALESLPGRDDVIDLAVMSFSRMVDGRVQAHTALGGGPLALFGGASLFTWPQAPADIARCLTDARTFDARKLFDDSAGRMAGRGRRACAATTIGALLHEVGHCLSLPHPTAAALERGGGIMARGFDFFDRLFVQPLEGEPLPFWDRGSAVRLRYHRFLQFEGERQLRAARDLPPAPTLRPMPNPTPGPQPEEADAGPVFEKLMDGSVVCTAPAGVGHIAYYKNGDNAAHDELLTTEPTTFLLPPLAEIRRRCCAVVGDAITLSAIDCSGRIVDTPYGSL